MSDDEPVINIRDSSLLGPFIGQRVIDITQQDQDEINQHRVSLHFSNGSTVTFFIGDEGFRIEHP